MVLFDRLILCMTPIMINKQPLVMLIGCMSGKLWRYEADTRTRSAPLCVLQLPDAVVSLRHVEDSHGSSVVLAGLANGCLAILDQTLLFDTNMSLSDVTLRRLGTSDEPVMDMCLDAGRLLCACGVQVHILEMTDWSIVKSVDVKDRFVSVYCVCACVSEKRSD